MLGKIVFILKQNAYIVHRMRKKFRKMFVIVELTYVHNAAAQVHKITL